MQLQTARDAASGRARTSRYATPDRPRATPSADRGHLADGPPSSSRFYEIDPLACPTNHTSMRVVAFITQASVIDRILAHPRTCAPPARVPRAPAGPTAREHRPVAPPPRGDQWGGRQSHRRVRSVPAAIAPPLEPPFSRPIRRASEAEGTPPPLCRCSRDRRSCRILHRPQSHVLSSPAPGVHCMTSRLGCDKVPADSSLSL